MSYAICGGVFEYNDCGEIIEVETTPDGTALVVTMRNSENDRDDMFPLNGEDAQNLTEALFRHLGNAEANWRNMKSPNSGDFAITICANPDLAAHWFTAEYPAEDAKSGALVFTIDRHYGNETAPAVATLQRDDIATLARALRNWLDGATAR